MKSHRIATALRILAICLPLTGLAALEKGKTYYTKANIWYERPEKVYSTNYHVGQMIPVGTEVEMLAYGRGKARFKEKKTGVEITFIHLPKHSSITADEFFERYFSEEDYSKELKKFTKMEQENIKAGTIAVGMGKDAVFAAYGNPPSHRTRSLDSNRWIYWRNRFANHVVSFADGKVVATK